MTMRYLELVQNCFRLPYVHMYEQIHIQMQVCVCVQGHASADMHSCVCARVHLCASAYVRANVHVGWDRCIGVCAWGVRAYGRM